MPKLPNPERKKGLTAVEDARERLKSFDIDYLEHLDRMGRYSMGEKGIGSRSQYFSGSNDFPIFSTAACYTRKIGASRRMLNIQMLNLSKFTGQDPLPEFPEVEAHVEEMRKKFYLKRSKGNGKADGGWDGAIQSAFTDGNGYGYGFVAFGKRRNAKTGKDYVDAEYIPNTQVIWEPLEPRFGKSSWVGLVRYISKAEAFAQFPEWAVKDSIRPLHDVSSNITYDYIRVVEYYDIGYGMGYDDSKPTYMVWLGDWDGDPIIREENVFGILPVAHYEHFIPKGKARAIGVVDQQVAVCEAINELEDQLLRVAKRHGIDFIDIDQVDPQDVKRWASGDPNLRFIKLTNPRPDKAPVIQRIPADEVGQTLLQLMNLYERQFNADSSSNDAERGATTETKRTASEIMQLAQGAQAAGGSTRKSTLKFYQRMVEVSLAVAAVIDNDPVQIDVFGDNITVNDPEVPEFSIESIMEEESEVRIAPASIEGVDTVREMQEMLAKLHELFPLVQMGTIRPDWYTEKVITALKLGDPKDAMVQPNTQGMAPAMMTPEQLLAQGVPTQGIPATNNQPSMA